MELAIYDLISDLSFTDLHESREELRLLELLLVRHELAVALVQGPHGDLGEVPLHAQLRDVLRVRLHRVDVALEIQPK